MEIFIYLLIFITGTFFGSFFTLAVYRIPKKEDILIKHSYCPNCNSKLGFFDLFPVLSYVFLGGKCRYCKQKIRPRYLILEILSGLAFLTLSIGLKLDVNNINSLFNIAFLLIYTSVLFIVAGIDKENIKIEKSVLVFGFIIELIYIIYQYILFHINIYQYVMYIIMFLIILIFVKKAFKIESNKDYIIKNLFLAFYMLIYSGVNNLIFTGILTLVLLALYSKLKKTNIDKMPIGFFMCINNISIIAILNIINNYIV